MYTFEEIRELLVEREDVYSIIDLLDPTPEELVEGLEKLVLKNYESLNEYFMEEIN